MERPDATVQRAAPARHVGNDRGLELRRLRDDACGNALEILDDVCVHVQSTFAPDSLTTLPHLAMSSRTNLPNCSGVPPAMSTPWSPSFFFRSSAFRALFTSAPTLATMSLGRFAGPSTPNQVTASKPLK